MSTLHTREEIERNRIKYENNEESKKSSNANIHGLATGGTKKKKQRDASEDDAKTDNHEKTKKELERLTVDS